MRKLTLMAALAALGITISASAGIEQLPLVEHDGVLCHFYEVQPKETIYSLSNRLGITSQQLIEANPQVADGLKANTILYFPVNEEELQPRTVTHQVKKGETIYGLSKQMGVSVDDLIASNPEIKDGLRAGQTISVTIPSAIPSDKRIATVAKPGQDESHATDAAAGGDGYVVKQGETFYSIAHANGITVSELEQANPMAGVLHPGDVLVIPKPDRAIAVEETYTDETTTIVPEPETATMEATAQESRKLKVALMLPFMLSQEKPDKAATRFTEFYKGFLLAADTLRNEGEGVSIYAYDTAGNNDSVRAILMRPEMKEMMMIIAPDSEQQLATIGEWGRDNSVMVLNTFVVRDTTQNANPVMMQANLPHGRMYDRAIDALAERYPDHRIVVLKRDGGPEDHAEFIKELNLRLGQKGVTPTTLTYSDKLNQQDLAAFASAGPTVFIPISGKQAELNRILPALIQTKSAAASPDDVMLFGYPEWITYRGETFEDMQTMNTIVYSRFYNDAEDPDTKSVEESFTRWYGRAMEQAVPRQGLLGFDTGMMVIRSLRNNHGNFGRQIAPHRGVQNGYDFRRAGDSETSGWVNDVLYFVNFRPGGVIDRTML